VAPGQLQDRSIHHTDRHLSSNNFLTQPAVPNNQSVLHPRRLNNSIRNNLPSPDRNPLRRQDIFPNDKHDDSEASDETPRHRHVPAQEHGTGGFGPAEFRLLEHNLQLVYDDVCRCNRVVVHFSSLGQIRNRKESPVYFLVSVQHANLTCLRTHVYLPSHRICLHRHEPRQLRQLHCSFERLHRMPV
jgi:hypothetical protein